MPWVGLTDGKLGYMLLWELPTACDNGNAVLDASAVGRQEPPGPDGLPRADLRQVRRPAHDPLLLRRRRRPCPRSAKRFREYIKGQGLLVTQREKLRNKPQLAQLQGAPDIWGRGDLRFVLEARAAGMDRMLVNSGQPKADMAKIKSLGYLMSVYDNYEDAFQGDTGHYGDFVTDRDVVVHADGKQMLAWNTKGDNPKQFMKRCSALFEKVARTWVPLDLEKYPYNSRFIDVTTATGLQECYHPGHPHDRTLDREHKRRLAKYIGDDLKLVLGGEHGRWWGADIYNYWEGMQSGGFYSWPAGYVGSDLPKTREEVGKQYLAWGLGEANRYPPMGTGLPRLRRLYLVLGG